VIFVVSDIHLGKKPETDRQSLHELQECISALNPTDVVFLGDTFDAFVEHPRYLPKQVVEWSEMVFLMQRNGINVHFVAGNHDRWHRGHIARLIGSEVRREAFTLSWSDRTIHLEHGDGIELLDTFTRFARFISDHPLSLRLYTLALPFGLGQRLASWVSRKYASFETNLETVTTLQRHAASIIHSGNADIVLMGHCHHPTLMTVERRAVNNSTSQDPISVQLTIDPPTADARAVSGLDLESGLATASPTREDGLYVNSGDWFEGRTFCLLEEESRAKVSLCRWTGSSIETIDHRIFDPR